MNSILKQMRNEWKSNAFLFLELMVVFAILWYIVDWVYVTGRVYFAPMGFDTEHCYELTVGKLDAKSALFAPGQTPEDDMDAFIEIAERLRHRPGVEHVAISQNSVPYNDGSNGFAVCVDTVPVITMRRWIQPEFFQVFRLQGVAVLGEDGRMVYTASPDSLAWALRSRPEALVLSDNFVSDVRHPELGLHNALPLLGRALPVNLRSGRTGGFRRGVRAGKSLRFISGAERLRRLRRTPGRFPSSRRGKCRICTVPSSSRAWSHSPSP